MAIDSKIRDYILKNRLTDIGDKVLVGLSGGADSVCLLFMLNLLKKDLKIDIVAIHVNHMIRGAEAIRDENFCKNLCAKLEIPLTVRRIDVPKLARENGTGLEETGREARYKAFSETAKERKCNKIAVAHHMNDSAETFIFQLLRGSRLSGLSGIKPVNGNIIRPLLSVTRPEIEKWLKDNRIDYVTDSTNKSDDYTRNYIRNTIIPAADKVRAGAVARISETSLYLARVCDYVDKQADALYDAAVSKDGNDLLLNTKKLSKGEPILAETVVYNALCKLAERKKDITHGFVDDILGLLSKQTGRKNNIKYGITAVREYDFIRLTKSGKNEIDKETLNCNNGACVQIIEYSGEGQDFGQTGPSGNSVKYFDLDKMCRYFGRDISEESVLVRTVSEDDRIATYSDGRGKKVMDVLKNLKIPASKRKKLTVAAVDNMVLLIPEIRGSEFCRIDDTTERILMIDFRKEQI